MTLTAQKQDRRFIDLVTTPQSAAEAKPTARPVAVRVASPADEQAVFDVLMLLAEENAMSPVSETKVIEAIRKGTRRDGGMVGIIDAPDRSIAATIGIVHGSWWYTQSWHCEELWSFVHPAHRKDGNNYARDLINFGKWWSEQMGLPFLMGVLSNKRTEGKVRLYRRTIPCVGALFLHRGGVI